MLKRRRTAGDWSRTVLDLAVFGLLLVSVELSLTALLQLLQRGGSWFETLLNLAIAFFGASVGLLLLRIARRDRRMVGLFGWLCDLDRLLGGLSPPLTGEVLQPVFAHLVSVLPDHCGWIGVLKVPGLLIQGEHRRRRYLPVASKLVDGGWSVGWAESVLRRQMDTGGASGQLQHQPLAQADFSGRLLTQVVCSPVGDLCTGLAVARCAGCRVLDPVTTRALTAGLTMLNQRIGGLLVEVIARREGLGLEHLGMVMRVLAHEINNDLQGALNRLDGQETPSDDLRVDLRAQLARAAHWSYLMREAPFLMDRMLPLERRQVSLSACLRQTLAESRAAWPEQLFVVDQPESGEVQVVGDQHLSCVLRNLVHNAASFSPEDAGVEITLQLDGLFAHVLVHDGGPGVDPADVERIFAPLAGMGAQRRRGERASHGMGVGLTISRAIARGYGGDLRCHSNQGSAGGLFELLLPLAADKGKEEAHGTGTRTGLQPGGAGGG
jgi:signal transduction histidine kinase